MDELIEMLHDKKIEALNVSLELNEAISSGVSSIDINEYKRLLDYTIDLTGWFQSILDEVNKIYQYDQSHILNLTDKLKRIEKLAKIKK